MSRRFKVGDIVYAPIKIGVSFDVLRFRVAKVRGANVYLNHPETKLITMNLPTPSGIVFKTYKAAARLAIDENQTLINILNNRNKELTDAIN